jgi:hypothetical protein
MYHKRSTQTPLWGMRNAWSHEGGVTARRFALCSREPMRVRCQRHDLAAGPDGLCIICRRQQATSRSDDGVALLMSKKPSRYVVGLVLVLGLSLAWYWMRHDLLGLGLSVRVLPSGVVASPALQQG